MSVQGGDLEAVQLFEREALVLQSLRHIFRDGHATVGRLVKVAGQPWIDMSLVAYRWRP